MMEMGGRLVLHLEFGANEILERHVFVEGGAAICGKKLDYRYVDMPISVLCLAKDQGDMEHKEFLENVTECEECKRYADSVFCKDCFHNKRVEGSLFCQGYLDRCLHDDGTYPPCELTKGHEGSHWSAKDRRPR